MPVLNLQAAAAGYIYDADGRVLLIKEAYGRFRYGPPGGVVEQGESPQAACVREVLEETGLVVRVDHLIGVRWVSEGRDVPWIGYGFRCSVVSGEPAVQDESEIAAVGWFDPHDPPQPLTATAALLLVPGVLGERGLAFGDEVG